MARILFTFAGGRGHLLPMLPLAQALAGAGHQLALSGEAAVLGDVVGAASFTDLLAHPPRPSTSSMSSPSAGVSPGTGTLIRPDLDHEYAVVGRWFAGTLAQRNAALTAERIAGWRPDLVVCDEMDFGSAVAAQAAGLPVVVVAVIATGALTRPEIVAGPRGPLTRLRAAYGLVGEPARTHGDLFVCPFPPAWRDPVLPDPPDTVYVRPTEPTVPPSTGERELDAAVRWFAGGERPRVYLTLGTVFNTESGDLFARALDALAGASVRVLATVGPDLDPAILAGASAELRIERFVAQAQLLAHADVVVNHGGSGSVIGALAHGVPVVVLPMGADQALNAARVRALACGSVLDPVEASAAEIRAAVATALVPSGRVGAADVAAQIAAMAPVSAAVSAIEALLCATH